jgi:Zn-dependent protease
MIINLIYQGQINLAILLIITIIISLTFHEFGHAWTAKKFGDNTAERMGRLTLNPVAHIDPIGLLMVVLIGFGYAKPVPTDPRNYNSPKASLWIAAAGPGMNLLLAFLFINLQAAALTFSIDYLIQPGAQLFLSLMAYINILLMLFNLIPLGGLDGHYILPYFLSREAAYKYSRWNAQCGNMLFLGLIIPSIAGLPIFSFLVNIAKTFSSFLVIF